MAISVGWRLKGLNTPACRCRAAALRPHRPPLPAGCRGQTGFRQTTPRRSPRPQRLSPARRSSPPEARHAGARPRLRKHRQAALTRRQAGRTVGRGEMRVHHAPCAVLLAERHGRARDELGVVVVDVLRRRLLAGPLPPRLAMAPHHRELAGDYAADVERRPVGRQHLLAVELPQPDPVLAAAVSVPVQIEERRLGGRAEQRLQVLPVEPRIDVDVRFVKP